MLAADTTSIALGSIFAEFEKKDMQTLFEWIEKMSIVVESGVQSVGPPATYALVWEFGNARQTKKGPKTVKSKNPDGKTVWLSIQAPHGWIAVHEEKIWDIIFQELSKVKLDPSGSEDNVKEELVKAYERIAAKALELLQSTVPVDSGELYDSLQIVSPDDSILKEVSSLANDIVGTLNL